jgi:hypothetical protein
LSICDRLQGPGLEKDPLSRAQELERVVDQLDAKVAREREAEGVPGKTSRRERAAVRGPETQPPD